jgi:hypothetical protein
VYHRRVGLWRRQSGLYIDFHTDVAGESHSALLSHAQKWAIQTRVLERQVRRVDEAIAVSVQPDVTAILKELGNQLGATLTDFAIVRNQRNTTYPPRSVFSVLLAFKATGATQVQPMTARSAPTADLFRHIEGIFGEPGDATHASLAVGYGSRLPTATRPVSPIRGQKSHPAGRTGGD